jgi:hypothetical protein
VPRLRNIVSGRSEAERRNPEAAGAAGGRIDFPVGVGSRLGVYWLSIIPEMLHPALVPNVFVLVHWMASLDGRA